MSCFIVSDTHINTLVHYIIDWANYDKMTREEIGNALLEANYESYREQYNEEDLETPKYTTSFQQNNPAITTLSPVKVLKACRCFDYQAREFGGWKDSVAYKLIDELIGEAIWSLPGYEDADWELQDNRGIRQ